MGFLVPRHTQTHFSLVSVLDQSFRLQVQSVLCLSPSQYAVCPLSPWSKGERSVALVLGLSIMLPLPSMPSIPQLEGCTHTHAHIQRHKDTDTHTGTY